MPELDVERVPVFPEVRLAPVRTVVIELQRRVRVLIYPAPPLTEQVPALNFGILLHGLAVRGGVGRNGRTLPRLAAVEISLNRDVVPLPRIGVRPEPGVPQVPAVEIGGALMELGVVIGESRVGAVGRAAPQL